jgi:hypothetical protein
MLFLRKNLILIIGMMIILGTHLVSCEKIPQPPVVEPEVRPFVELSVTPEGVIPYGGRVDIIWGADKKTKKIVVKVNDEIKETITNGSRAGALTLGPLFKDMFVSVTAINVNLSFEVEKEIKVGDWTSSKFGLVSKYPWRYDSLGRSSLDGKVLKRWKADPELSSFVDYYHKDGTVTYSNYPGLKISWFLPDDNSITINGATRKLQVNQEQMIISYQGTYDGETVWFDMIYEHASDTPTDPE